MYGGVYLAVFSPLLTTIWVIQMSQVVLNEPFDCIKKDLSSGNKIFKGKSQHSPHFSTGKRSCWFQEVEGKLGFKNNRKQLQAQILTNSKYFIKNNSITPSVEKGKVIDCKKSNVTSFNYNHSSQKKSTDDESISSIIKIFSTSTLDLSVFIFFHSVI